MDNNDIDHLLDLARLEIDNTEKESLKEDLSKVLKYVDQLLEVDVKDVIAKTGGTENVNVVRNEALENRGFERERVMNEFPSRNGEFLSVPNVFE